MVSSPVALQVLTAEDRHLIAAPQRDGRLGAHRDGVAIPPSKKEDLEVAMLATGRPPPISAEPEARKVREPR
jgi:hypothetical protein